MCVLPFNIVGNSLHYNIISTSTLSRCRTTGFFDYQPMCLNLPFCCWKMRRGFNETLLATDATQSSGGATRAPLPSALARELWKLCGVRGEAIRLDRTDDLPRWDDFDAPKAPSQFASVVAETLPWYVAASYHFRQTSHINLQETRALRREIALMAQDVTNHGSIQVCLNDSRVVVGAATKGRSSSFKLNGILRTLIPLLTNHFKHFYGIALG